MPWPGQSNPIPDPSPHDGTVPLGPQQEVVIASSRRRRTVLPAILFIATCASTYFVGGLAFALPLMITLTAHEMGHFLQARRYGVPASWPFFIPVPFSPIGTMGAVIGMRGGMGDRRSLFDIGITGPLAGLVPALLFTIVGLSMSEITVLDESTPALSLGEPLLFKVLTYLIFGPLAENQDVMLHSMAFAGWVGIFITALNLIPIGQLDGGHILYALLRDRARPVASLLLMGAALAVIVFGYWGWVLMILLLSMIGPVHPPTANDDMPLGTGRTLLGWLSLGFVFVGFTPTPFIL